MSEVLIAQLDRAAVVCKRIHPDGDCWRIYQRNAAALRAIAART